MSFGVQFVNPDANLINATSNGIDTIRAFNDWTLAFRTVFNVTIFLSLSWHFL